jgi:DNA end-binding protein Ku
MQRSLWRGAISFGLIYVPVEMYAAAKDGALTLHLLDRRDFSPVGYQRINKKSGKEVSWQNIVKGYEYKKGEYVALSDADFVHANIKATQTIQIDTFTDAASIPPLYFETPYYLAPAKGGEKVYALLADALRATSKVAIATFVMRGRQHLCAVATLNDMLVLLTLRFANEVLPPQALASVNLTGLKGLSSSERAMAKKLVEEMSGAWNPNAFKDTYRADLMRRIQEKIRKKQTHALASDTESAAQRPKAQVIDLMEALKKSLKSRGASMKTKSSAKRAARG